MSRLQREDAGETPALPALGSRLQREDAGETPALPGMKSLRSGKQRPISKLQTGMSVLLVTQRINRILACSAHGGIKGADAAADNSHQ